MLNSTVSEMTEYSRNCLENNRRNLGRNLKNNDVINEKKKKKKKRFRNKALAEDM